VEWLAAWVVRGLLVVAVLGLLSGATEGAAVPRIGLTDVPEGTESAPPSLTEGPPGWLRFRDRLAEWMTPERAAFVRRLRVDDDLTWRGVAGECSAAWGTDWDENQGVGMFLCEIAARLLGEDPDAPPWN
jgi:hypothetical protein